MELMEKQGYKQTEVGLIPEDWEITTFGNIADKSVKNSITGGPFGSNLKTDDYTNDGVQIIQLQNIGDGEFIDKSVVYTSVEKANELKSCNIYPGEIILSKMGDPVARACIMPFKAKRFLMASDGIRLVVDENKFSKHFVFHYINSKYFRNRAIDVSTGSTRQRIGLPELKSLDFIKPTLTEQKAIATALSDVDALITSLEQTIAKKKAIKQGAMQQLLTPPHKGGKRLPGFEGEWVETVFSEICSLVHGHQFRTEDFNHNTEGIKVIKIGNVMPNQLISDGSDTISSQRLQEFENFLLKEGDILMSLTGNIGRVVRLQTLHEPLLQNYRVGKFVPDENIDPSFLSISLGSIETTRQLEQLSNAAAQANFGKQDFDKVNLFYPIDKKEQKAIAQILSDMDAEITQLETKKEKYQAIKQGMMQELLTGKTRLV